VEIGSAASELPALRPVAVGNVFSFLKNIDFRRLILLIAQRRDFLIFGIVVPALGRSLVGEPNDDANLKLARAMKTPEAAAPHNRLAAVLCDEVLTSIDTLPALPCGVPTGLADRLLSSINVGHDD
jgi:hypothetical protein